MVAHEDVFNGVKIGKLNGAGELTSALSALIPNNLTVHDVVFLCVGTDRSTGDSMGPFVGTYLRGLGYTNVVGTIDDPTHAMNLAERIAALPAGKTVIAVDACLGLLTSVGLLHAYKGGIKPGAGVKKELPKVGDYAITGTVNISGFMGYHVLQNTRLSNVIKMAKDITSAIVNIFPLDAPAAPVKKKRERPRKNAAKAEVCV